MPAGEFSAIGLLPVQHCYLKNNPRQKWKAFLSYINIIFQPFCRMLRCHLIANLPPNVPFLIGFSCVLNSSPILRSLSKELAPAYLRLGGTYCDFLTFEGEAREEYSKTFSNKTLTGQSDDVGDCLAYNVK